MTRRRRLILAGSLLAAATLLAFVFQDVVRTAVILPLSYLWWSLTILYHSIAQVIYWVVLVAGVLLMAFGSLYGGSILPQRERSFHRHERGPVQNFAWWLTQRGRGTYFKWRVANRMGELAREMLRQRGDNPPGPPFALRGRDWEPPEAVGNYLEAGLNRSFAEFPRRGWFFPPPQTPFDMEIDPVVEYLESQMETNSDRRHP